MAAAVDSFAMSLGNDASAISPPPRSGAAAPAMVLEKAFEALSPVADPEASGGFEALETPPLTERNPSADSDRGTRPLPVPTTPAESRVSAVPGEPLPAAVASIVAHHASPELTASVDVPTPRRRSVTKREIGLIYSSMVSQGGMNVSPTQGVRRLAKRLRGGPDNAAPLPLQDCLQIVPVAQLPIAPEVARARERAARARCALAARKASAMKEAPSARTADGDCGPPAGPLAAPGSSADGAAAEVDATSVARGHTVEGNAKASPETALVVEAATAGPRRRVSQKAMCTEGKAAGAKADSNGADMEMEVLAKQTEVEAVCAEARAAAGETQPDAACVEARVPAVHIDSKAADAPKSLSSVTSKKRIRARTASQCPRAAAGVEAEVTAGPEVLPSAAGAEGSSSSASSLHPEAPTDAPVEAPEEPPRQVKKPRMSKQVQHLLSLKARQREKYLRSLNPAQQMRLAIALSLAEGGA